MSHLLMYCACVKSHWILTSYTLSCLVCPQHEHPPSARNDDLSSLDCIQVDPICHARARLTAGSTEYELFLVGGPLFACPANVMTYARGRVYLLSSGEGIAILLFLLRHKSVCCRNPILKGIYSPEFEAVIDSTDLCFLFFSL